MIGIIANDSEHAAIAEFFELFKTPWEFYRGEQTYEVVLCTLDNNISPCATKLTMFYAAHGLPIDCAENIDLSPRGANRILLYKGSRIPIYGGSVTFREERAGLEADDDPRQSGMYVRHSKGRTVARVGYDLFAEVATLLTRGQPLDYADIPTLEMHIGLLRDLILASGAGLVEVPAVPAGYRFIACLTHDVDHPSIVKHKLDHTMFGFLYRALFGSVRNLALGRISVRNLAGTWVAAFKLPFVYLGLAKDPWRGFVDRYLELEKGLPSTFFVIPFKGDPGRSSQDIAPGLRAAGYGAKDIADVIAKIGDAGCEVGLHGIDAWIDSSKGREEFDEIRRLTKTSEIGVRMHWLYYDQQSPMELENAGAAYDSTVGYRDTVGYRSGTTQAYKPIHALKLLELPMHIMDTALFYPTCLNLSQQCAVSLLERMVGNVAKFGGCITVNWHDRSLAPERNWESSYRDLVAKLKSQGAWFATAGQASSWFRKRRSVVFHAHDADLKRVNVNSVGDDGNALPGLRVRVYEARESCQFESCEPNQYVENTIEGSVTVPDPCGARG
jgi:hypothetical protein